MDPHNLQGANTLLHKLHQKIDDLAELECTQSISDLTHSMSESDRTAAIEFIRPIAVKSKTSEIKALMDHLTRAGVKIEGNYVDHRLRLCREYRQNRDDFRSDIVSVVVHSHNRDEKSAMKVN